MILLQTTHGSRLYGTHNKNSDYDSYTVTLDKSKTKHSIKEKDDSLIISLDSFLLSVDKGVPQSLEALFSRKKSISHPLIESLYPDTYKALQTYLRTIKSFLLQDNLKSQRHAIRMSFNLSDLVEFGYFDPSLSPSQLDKVLIRDTMDRDEIVRYILDHSLSYNLHEEFLSRL